MNYRHIYHAGNFADVMKHLAMVLIIDHLKKKEAPFCVIDAHGGCGLYDLSSPQSMKTREYEGGIGRFSNLRTLPDDFRLYDALVRPFMEKTHYPGSPLLAQTMLRPQDRLIANELHPEDRLTLQSNLSSRVTAMDAYECIRAHIPPREKRGLILIDPPFEKKDEFETLSRQMKEWKKRFATGVFMVWYPIKAHSGADAMKEAAAELDLPRTWCVEAMLHPRNQKETFNGCGLVIFNAPYMIPERMEILLPFLANTMGLIETPGRWLVP